MMRFKFIFFMIPLSLSACTVIHQQSEIPSGIKAVKNPEELQMEITLGNQILKTIKENNYKNFVRLLAGQTNLQIYEKDFKTSYGNLEKQFGKIESWQYTLELKTPLVRNLVWVVKFHRENERSKAEQEMLFRLITARDDGKIKVMGMGFF